MSHPAAPSAMRRPSERTAREVFFAMLAASATCLLIAAGSIGLIA